MHGVMLGVSRSLLHMWLESSNFKQLFYLGKRDIFSIIENRLVAIRPPNEISRLPRTLTSRKEWKASEYRNFLLYNSLPILCDILPSEYFQHLELLVKGIYVLLKRITAGSALPKKMFFPLRIIIWRGKPWN